MLGGITTYADMYYFENEVARVTRDAGMRGVLGETIVGFPARTTIRRKRRWHSPSASSASSGTTR